MTILLRNQTWISPSFLTSWKLHPLTSDPLPPSPAPRPHSFPGHHLPSPEHWKIPLSCSTCLWTCPSVTHHPPPCSSLYSDNTLCFLLKNSNWLSTASRSKPEVLSAAVKIPADPFRPIFELFSCNTPLLLATPEDLSFLHSTCPSLPQTFAHTVLYF